MCVLPATHHADLALESEPAFVAFRDQLVDAGLLVPMDVRGLYGRGARFERVVEAFEDYVARTAKPLGYEKLRFPPLFARSNYAKVDHIRNFPDLMGSVHTFAGKDRDHLAMWDPLESTCRHASLSIL